MADWRVNQAFGKDLPTGAEYDARLARRLEGQHPHGEADFVEALRGRTVLDGGCGTGRVGIELARRGLDVVGVDVDPGMLDTARIKATDVEWVQADLADVDLGRTFDVVLLAGNVMIFVGRGQEGGLLRNMARHLAPAGRLVAGFQLIPGGLTVAEYDRLAAAAGLILEERWSTWERQAWQPSSNYAVSVHRVA
ncbi:MAG: class I SAM-dependent DNA methyltransferase [Chloroflexota bacterium]